MRVDLSKRLSVKELKTPLSEFLTPFGLTFEMGQSVEEVLTILQHKKAKHVDYFYIVDKDNLLEGVISIHDILYNTPKTKMMDIVDPEVIKANQDDPLEKALKLMQQHEVLVLPIIDDENHFKGVLEVLPNDTDSFFKSKRLHQKTVKEDLFQFIGFSIEQGKLNSSWIEFRYRMPWIACNLVGGLICAVIGEFFQLTLMEFVVLALFIPLVLTLSESIAIQSMTLSLRFLHFKKIHWIQVWRRIFVEWKTSFLLGLGSAIIITLFYFAWSLEVLPILAIATSVIIAMMASATFGCLFPVFLHLLKLDPKVAAGPVVLMIADIVTISIYLGVATAFLV